MSNHVQDWWGVWIRNADTGEEVGWLRKPDGEIIHYPAQAIAQAHAEAEDESKSPAIGSFIRLFMIAKPFGTPKPPLPPSPKPNFPPTSKAYKF